MTSKTCATQARDGKLEWKSAFRCPSIHVISEATLIHQCAWCRRLTRGGKRVGPPLPSLLDDASHGICPECMKRELEKSGLHVREDELA